MSLLKVSAYTQTVDRVFDSSFTGTGRAPTVAATSDDEQTTLGLVATANFEFPPSHRTVVGFEYDDDRWETTKGSTVSFAGPSPPPIRNTSFTDATIKTASLFGQHEVTFGDFVTTVAARYYNVDSDLDEQTVNGVARPGQSNSDDRWLGSAGLVYKLNEGAILRANISQGYTFPSLSELFLTTSAGGQVINGNPELAPETATNYEIGTRIDRGGIVLDAAVFYTQADDYITTVADPNRPGQRIYDNVDSADSWGFELAPELDPG